MVNSIAAVMFFAEVQGSNFFAPAPQAFMPSTQWQPAQVPTYVAQPYGSEPVYAAAYGAPAYVAPAQSDDGEFSTETYVLACFAFGAMAGYGAYSVLAVGGDEPTEKEMTIGAAGLGGIAGVVLFGSLPGAVILAGAAAYGAVKNDTVKSAGSAAAKVYNKAVDIEQEYEVLPKAKSALDTVVSVADNLNKNYGLTDKIDAKLQLSARAESLSDKFNAQKDKLTSKVDELKDKASN
jgi:hypothetical protein